MSIAREVVRLSSSVVAEQRGRDFILLARAVALSNGGHAAARRIAEDAELSRTVLNILDAPDCVYDLTPERRTAISPGSTTDPNWSALAQYDQLTSGFLQSLRAYGALDRLLPFMILVPPRTRVSVVTTGATGAGVAQSAPKVISRLSLSATSVAERKATAVTVVSEELARLASPSNVFEVELSAAVAVTSDAELINNVLIPGAPSFAASGVTAEHVWNDLRALLSLVATGVRSKLFLLTTTDVCTSLAAMYASGGAKAFEDMRYNGGTIAGIEVIASDGSPASTMTLVDASQLGGSSGSIALDASKQATIEMSDSPDSPAVPGMTSLWQNNLIGLKTERHFSCEKLTPTAAAVCTNVGYTGDSPGP